MEQTVAPPAVTFEINPAQYKHWKLTVDGNVATLAMDVREDAGLRPHDYKLKLNSYDLGVDIELADVLQRLRFEHPEVHAVVLTSLKPRIFCAGANIFMLGSSSHAFKVNFCKFTNETRLGMEDMSANSGIKFLAAVNGICAGGGYELALACDEILLVDDGSASVGLPETPLLGVLPGTGGLTRVVDKRKVRRDLADDFSTLTEGVRGKRAVEGRFVDAVYPTSKFQEAVAKRAQELAAKSDRPESGPGITLGPLSPAIDGDTIQYKYVKGAIDRAKRTCELTISAPDSPQPASRRRVRRTPATVRGRCARSASSTMRCCGCGLNEPEIGTVILRAVGDPEAVIAVDQVLHDNAVALAGARDHRPDPPHAEAHGPHLAQLLRADRAGQRLRRHVVRAGARRRSRLHDRSSGRAQHDSPVGDERRRVSDEQRPVAPAGAIPRRARFGREGARRTTARSTRRKRSKPAWCSRRPTTSTGTTKCAWRSRRARRSRPTR